MVDQERTVDNRAVNHSLDTTHPAHLWTVGGILVTVQHKLSTISMLTN